MMRAITSLCVIILWIKFFYFLRIFDQTATLIRMIVEIVNDMKNFLIVLIVAIIGFSQGYYVLQQGDPNNFAGPGVMNSIIYSYNLALGEFGLDYFSDGDTGTLDAFICWFIFIIATMFVVIVLLNLLIAIMGDSFSRVMENITNLSVREKVMMIAENEALFNRHEIFQQSRYLIIFKEKNLESTAGGAEGQIASLKRIILDNINQVKTNIETKINENQKDLKKVLSTNDEKSKLQIGKISEELVAVKKEIDISMAAT